MAPGKNQPPDTAFDLSIIIPAYNEAGCIGRTVSAISDFAATAEICCELIVVDDGSQDQTSVIVKETCPETLPLKLISNTTNRGKGFSVRRGMLAAEGELLLMSDADLSSPIAEFAKLHKWIEQGFDVVIGSRDLPDSHLDPQQPLLRRWPAWIFRNLRRWVLLPRLRDTQCGFKCFRQAAARAVFSRSTIDGWLFDCEVLGWADRLGYRIKEVGVTWRNHPDSKVNIPREIIRSLPTLLRIRSKLSEGRDGLRCDDNVE